MRWMVVVVVLAGCIGETELVEPGDLLLISRTATGFEFHQASVDGSSRTLLHSMDAASPDHVLSTFRPSPNGDGGVLTTVDTTLLGIELTKQSILQWVRVSTGTELSLVDAASSVDDGICERGLAMAVWRSDAEAVFLACSVHEGMTFSRDSIIEAAIVEVSADGTATRLDEGCGLIGTPTDEAGLVFWTSTACTELGRTVHHPSGTEIAMGIGEQAHAWHAGGVITSQVQGEGAHRRQWDLRRISLSGESEQLEPELEGRLISISPNGELVATTENDGRYSFRIRDTGGDWHATDLDDCVDASWRGWSADGSALAVRCRDADWLLEASGNALALDTSGLAEDETVRWRQFRWDGTGDYLVAQAGNAWEGRSFQVNDARGRVVRSAALDDIELSWAGWMDQTEAEFFAIRYPLW